MNRFTNLARFILIVWVGTTGLAMAIHGQMPSSNPHWIWQNPLPQGDTIGAASFHSPDLGWAVGMTQGILHTTDGGMTWERQRFGPPFGFFDVCFCKANKGCAVGESSTDGGFTGDSIIWRTNDGGKTWKQKYVGVGEGGLGAVTFTSKKKGWAVGRWGTILKTKTGGRKWKKVAVPAGAEHYDLTDVSFPDKKHGWAIGGLSQGASDYNIFLRTRDGGRSWDLTYFNMSEGLSILWRISFPTETEGWAVGDEGRIYHTSDGGTTWSEQESPHTDTFIQATDVHFTDANTGYVVTSDGYLLTTINGGANWEIAHHENSEFYSIAFSDVLNGWAFGADGMAVKTLDGGDSWQKATQGTTEMLLGCSFADLFVGWAVGDFGTALGTTDGGHTWRDLQTGTEEHLRAVKFIDREKGWAVGDSGTILHTYDGGESWTPQTSETDQALAGVDFVDSFHGWAVGGDTTLLRTEDGGETWTASTAAAAIDLYTVDFVDTLHGWAAGEGPGRVLRTDDGGKTWDAVEVIFFPGQSVAGYFSVRFLNEHEGWLCGAVQVGLDDATVIGHTTDGGWTWESQHLNVHTDHILRAMAVTEDGRGWASGEHGVYYTTTNGGDLWTEQARPCPEEWILGMDFPSADTGYMVGSGGSILKTTDGGGAE